MLKQYYQPDDFTAGTDSERIQAAIDTAVKTGCNKVIIPRINQKSSSARWVIDKTILLPSDITLILDNCYLVMADDVMCRMFENSNSSLPVGRTLAGEQKNIRIIGIGHAVLDGGKDNGLSEYTSLKNGFPCVDNNVTIRLCNVRDFVIDNITIRDQRWWAIELLFSRKGRITNIHFEIINRCGYDEWRNQDGIDLRVGCNNILIQNITGETGDDTVALTALMNPESHEYPLRVEGKDSNIHDITIRDIAAVTNMCALVRLLNQFGHQVYNILIDNVRDISTPVSESKTQKVIRIGEYWYFKGKEENKAKHGDMHDITISNIYSRALSAIHLEMTVKNFHVSNVHVHSDGHYAVTCGRWSVFDHIFMYRPEWWDLQKNMIQVPDSTELLFPEDIQLTAENVLIENIYYSAENENEKLTPAICGIHDSVLKNFVLRNVHADESIPVIYTSDGKPAAGITVV